MKKEGGRRRQKRDGRKITHICSNEGQDSYFEGRVSVRVTGGIRCAKEKVGKASE